MKKNIGAVFFVFFSVITAFSENTVYELGPKIDDTVVFTAARDKDNNETFSTQQLEKFADDLKNTKLPIRVIIAITDNDTPDLPKTVPVQTYKNTKRLITKIGEYKTAAVFILSDGSPDRVKISAGAHKKTSPAWLVHDIFEILKSGNLKADFHSNNIILYRLGIINGDKLLGEYLDSEIAAIKLSYGADITPVLNGIINNYAAKGISKKWDKHYNLKNIFGYRIISEKTLVTLILIITFSGLLYTFMFSFLFGKKKEKHIRDLLRLWRVPIFFFVVNIFSFYAGENIVKLIFYIKFETISVIEQFPVTVVFCKFLFGSLLSFLFMNLIAAKLPRNTFIYAYLTNLICFINIFIFSSFDLSLSLFFSETYLLSFMSAKFKKIYMQTIFLILNAALLLYYFLPIFFITDNLIKIFFYASNITAAAFFVPYNLIINRLILRIKKDTQMLQNKFFFPITAAGIFFVSILFIFVHPAFAAVPQKNLFLIYGISDSGNSVKLVSDFTQEDRNAYSAFDNLQNIKTDSFIEVFAKSENYLERSIGEITITPLEEAAVIHLRITKENGFPVYEANTEFTADATGNTASFLSPLNTKEPFTVRFSGEKNARLHVKVSAWFYAAKINVSETPVTAASEFSNWAAPEKEDQKLKDATFLFETEKEFTLDTRGIGR